MPRACKRHPLKSVAVNFPKFKVKHFSHATLRRMPLAIMPAILYISYLSSSGSPWTHFGTYISTPTFGRGLHAFQASTAMHPDDYRVCPKSRNGYMLPFDTCRAELMCLDKPTYSLQCGAPLVINWFINPSNYIVISPINHSYWSYKPT